MSKQTDLINIPDAITVSGSNVGIGTSSPSNYNSGSNNLVVGASSGDNGITIATGTTNGGLLAFADGTTGNSAYRGYIQYDHNSDFLAVGSAGTEAMRIDSSGKVGINTTTMQSTFNVNGTDGNIANFSYSAAAAELKILATTVDAIGIFTGTNDNFIFGTNSTERMRLDASGNLLVGTTSTTPWTNGAGTSADNAIALREDGLIAASRWSGNAAFFNRTANDGAIVVFNKDGSTVGSIGTQGTAMTIGNGVTGLRFSAAGYVHPHNVTTNAASNGTTDLGASTAKFKDLYLSGGVYLGGTGSANKLDDYETGTWTPTLTFGDSSAGFVYNGFQIGRYTKIGNLVTLFYHVRLSTKGSASGSARISNFPFVANSSDTAIEGSVHVSGYWTGLAGSPIPGGYVQKNTTKLIYINTTAANGISTMTDSNFTNSTNMYGYITYYT